MGNLRPKELKGRISGNGKGASAGKAESQRLGAPADGANLEISGSLKGFILIRPDGGGEFGWFSGWGYSYRSASMGSSWAALRAG